MTSIKHRCGPGKYADINIFSFIEKSAELTKLQHAFFNLSGFYFPEINERNLPIYEQVFHKNRKNPNGCNTKATFFGEY